MTEDDYKASLHEFWHWAAHAATDMQADLQNIMHAYDAGKTMSAGFLLGRLEKKLEGMQLLAAENLRNLAVQTGGDLPLESLPPKKGIH